MTPEDRDLLGRWLALIARFREHGWITEADAAELRAEALEAVS